MKVWNVFAMGAENRKSWMFTPSRPGAFGDGNFLKYCDAATFGPMPSGSIAATWAGESPYHPDLTGWEALKPWTDPPGHSPGFWHRYMRTPSRSESEGTAR